MLLLAAACQNSKSEVASGSAGPGASAPAIPSAATSAAAPSKAWFEGNWQGSFQAELFRVETAAGGVKEWRQDDGKRANGEGKLSLEVTADGTARGSATGALGELAVSGRVDGERAALQLSSATAEGFHGTILATQAPEGMKGTLSASSGDSLQVRQGSVTLARK